MKKLNPVSNWREHPSTPRQLNHPNPAAEQQNISNGINQQKAKVKLEVNLYLLTIAFTLFTFIIAINPALVKNNIYLSLQLTLAIPLLISSIFVRTQLSYSEKSAFWETYGFITFILAYAFLINVVGILLSTLVSVGTGIIFWSANVLLALLYSLLEVREDRTKIGPRLWKDVLFIAILLCVGLLPVWSGY